MKFNIYLNVKLKSKIISRYIAVYVVPDLCVPTVSSQPWTPLNIKKYAENISEYSTILK